MAILDEARILGSAWSLLDSNFRAQVRTVAKTLLPLLPQLQRPLQTKLKPGTAHRRELLQALTVLNCGSILRRLSDAPKFESGLEQVVEQVNYTGRRLAKLGLNPGAVIDLLSAYNQLLDREILRRKTADAAMAGSVRSQLHAVTVLGLNEAFYQVRASESQASYELFRAETESLDLEEKASRYLQILMQYTGAAHGSLYAFEKNADTAHIVVSSPRGSGQPGARIEISRELRRRLSRPQCLSLDPSSKKTLDAGCVLNLGWRDHFKTCWSIPVKSGGGLLFAFQFGFEKPYAWLPREAELLQGVAERFGQAAEKSALIAELRLGEEKIRRLASHMVEIEEAERRRISRELHDEAGQSLLCVRLQLEMIEQDLAGTGASSAVSNEALSKRLRETRDLTEHSILEIRRLIAALSPAILDQMGLAAAIRQLVARFRKLHPASVRLQLPRRLDVDKKTEIIVYRLVQEVFNNIAKYSSASNVNLSMESADGFIRLSVEDDGVGFDVQEAFSRRDCFGLSGLRERVALLGGALVVTSSQQAVQSTAGTPRTIQKKPVAPDLRRGGKKTTPTAVGASGKARKEARERAADSIETGRRGTQIRIQFPVRMGTGDE